MNSLLQALRTFGRDEEGPTAVEYAVMLALIIVVCFTAVSLVGGQASRHFSNTALTVAIGSP